MLGKSEGFVREIVLSDETATNALGAAIAGVLRAGDTVALEGDLGSGKTTLARAILRKLGIGEAVPSPSFTLLQQYETANLTVSHFDLYRLQHESEADELGIEAALESGAALIEWPERAASRISKDTLHVSLEATSETVRHVTLSGPAQWEQRLGETERGR